MTQRPTNKSATPFTSSEATLHAHGGEPWEQTQQTTSFVNSCASYRFRRWTLMREEAMNVRQKISYVHLSSKTRLRRILRGMFWCKHVPGMPLPVGVQIGRSCNNRFSVPVSP